MSVYVLFPDETTWAEVTQEIAATPDIEGGAGPTWLWFDPANPENIVTPAIGADGRRLIAHHWSAVDRDWLAAYLAAWPAVQVLSAMPPDWVPEVDPEVPA